MSEEEGSGVSPGGMIFAIVVLIVLVMFLAPTGLFQKATDKFYGALVFFGIVKEDYYATKDVATDFEIAAFKKFTTYLTQVSKEEGPCIDQFMPGDDLKQLGKMKLFLISQDNQVSLQFITPKGQISETATIPSLSLCVIAGVSSNDKEIAGNFHSTYLEKTEKLPNYLPIDQITLVDRLKLKGVLPDKEKTEMDGISYTSALYVPKKGEACIIPYDDYTFASFKKKGLDGKAIEELLQAVNVKTNALKFCEREAST